MSVEVADRVGVAGVEGEHGVAQDVFAFAAELALDDLDELVAVEVEQLR